jgi:hypothetical protein
MLEFTFEAYPGDPLTGLCLNSSNLTIIANITGAVKPLLMSNFLHFPSVEGEFLPLCYRIVRLVGEVPCPLGDETVTVPVVAPVGTTTFTTELVADTGDVGAAPVNWTLVTPAMYLPLIVIVLPTLVEVVENPVMVGAATLSCVGEVFWPRLLAAVIVTYPDTASFGSNTCRAVFVLATAGFTTRVTPFKLAVAPSRSYPFIVTAMPSPEGSGENAVTEGPIL